MRAGSGAADDGEVVVQPDGSQARQQAAMGTKLLLLRMTLSLMIVFESCTAFSRIDSERSIARIPTSISNRPWEHLLFF
jgi:hypothetical protein